MDEKQKIMSTEALRKQILDVEYPSNSHKKKAVVEETADKKVEKIISGGAKTKKRSFSKKVAEMFVGDDVGNVSSYILYDVLIPAAKSTLSEMVSSGIEMLLFGEAKKGSRTQRDRGKSYVSYSSYYKGDRNDRQRESSVNRARHSFDDIILESRGDAEEVLSFMLDLISDYGIASVADLNNLVGISGNYTDNKWGWDNLSSATVDRVRGGYLINLPRASAID